MVNEFVEDMGRGASQLASGDPWSMVKGAGNLGLGGLGYVTAPINAPLHTIVGEPVEHATGSPLAGSLAEAGAGFALPVPKGIPRIGKAAELPAELEFGVTLSGGEAANDLAMRQKEQASIRRGEQPAWEAQRAAQLEAAQADIAKQLDPGGQNIAETPTEAGDIVSGSLQRTEADRRQLVNSEAAFLVPTSTVHPLDAADNVAQTLRNSADAVATTRGQTAQQLQTQHEALRASLSPDNVVLARSPQEAADIVSGGVTRAEEQAREARDAAYDNFRAQEGTFAPTAFRGVGNTIKRSLNAGDDPVILNGKTTPMALAAMQDLDRNLGAAVRNAAAPETKTFAPFTPASIDDARKRLIAFQRQANSSARATNDFSDVRAMGRVMDGFDDLVQQLLRSPATFSGDGNAVAASIAQARGLHSDLRQTFSRQGSGDAVGPVMQKIVGQRFGQAAPPNQIAQWLYGNGATPPLVAQRMINVFGANSPEVAAIKQGLFSHITERPEGVTAWGPEQVADRIYDFTNGRGRTLTQTYFTPTEQQQLRAYADSLRASVAPPVAPNDVVARALSRISGVGGQGATSGELADTLFGRAGLGENPLGVKLAQHVQNTYGPGSDAFNSLRQGMFSRLVRSEAGPLGFDPEKIAGQIGEFLDGRGRPMANTLYSPAEQTQLRNYADALRSHAENAAMPTSEVDRAMAKIAGRDGPPATPREVADLLYSRSVARDRNLSVNLARRLKDQFGESSPQWSAVKQGLFQQLTNPGEGMTAWGPQKIGQRLNKFLNVDGTEMSQVLYSPQERKTLQNYADLMNRITMPPGSYFPSAPPIQAAMAAMRARVGGIVGALIGRTIVPIPLVGELAGLAAGSQTERALERLHSGVSKQLPIVADQMAKWSRAQSAAMAQPMNPLLRQGAVGATVNLQKALTPLGIDMKQLSGVPPGPGPGNAQPNQQNVPRPVGQQHNGGRIEQQRATGGKVGGDFRHKGPLNRGIGVKARRAKDGRLIFPMLTGRESS